MTVIAISADMKQRAYDYYAHHRSVSIKSIATFLGVSPTTFRRLRRDWSWPPRAAALAAGTGTPTEAGEATGGERHASPFSPTSLREAAMSLAGVTRARIEALVREHHSNAPLDHDKAARTLAAYAKTLTTAQALLEQDNDRLDDSGHEAAPARSIHDLRDELARHLERIVAEEEARGGDGILV